MEDYNVEGLLLLVKALHTYLFILMCFACCFLYFSRLVQVVMKTALTVTLIIMMIVTRIPLVQVRVVAEVVELEVVVPEPKELYYVLQLLFLMRDTETLRHMINYAINVLCQLGHILSEKLWFLEFVTCWRSKVNPKK